ncbi:lipocalin family protein [Methylobacter sp. BlB1]|jgi:apolipoprotein D and lipocalin family protein|uniref:lipocalin family protein n=1 Tax=Methylobacter sp. BlB1 TaxID=2785914 RepID=UPI00189590FF|nr:lipocalin family protein [Methylobacter sp. BlB1]
MPYLSLLLLMLVSGCIGLPSGVKPVTGFELNRYLGKWYEIARLDHSFERGLTDVTAEYSLKGDGGVSVLNSGFNAETGQRQSAEGKAYFVESPDVGRLKVSFFGPFYGAYNIIALDKANYSYAMIAGPDRDYLWILSRTPTLDPKTLQALIDQAQSLGFATQNLIYP